MFYSRVTAVIVFVLTCALSAIALPAETSANDGPTLEKRIWHEGRGTYFYTGLGACGWENVDSDYIAAIGHDRYDANGGGNCGQWIWVQNTATGQGCHVLTVDRCESCSPSDLDMSVAAFNTVSQTGDGSPGVLDITWHFEPMGFQKP